MNGETDRAKHNPYDELPYLAMPIRWTAPEALATVSLIHGGPRVDASRCRVLELGCANAANLLPMAYFRPDCRFTGIDNSAVQIETARQCRDKLGLGNLDLVETDFAGAPARIEGPFDIIIAHGIFSWISRETREALLHLCQSVLAEEGLLYLNYNSLPGWNVRGMVREFLLHQTASISDLLQRAERCRELSAEVIAPLGDGEHPYTQLMRREFQLVSQQFPAYIAHEYLSPINRAFWRTELLELVAAHGFDYVADADFNDVSSRIIRTLGDLLSERGLEGRAVEDSADLLCYRQMHSPMFTRAPSTSRECSDAEFLSLWVSAGLEEEGAGAPNTVFRHPDGRTVESRDASLRDALSRLCGNGQAGIPLKALIEDPLYLRDDLESLYAEEFIELRCCEPSGAERPRRPLHEVEKSLHGMLSTPWHTISPA